MSFSNVPPRVVILYYLFSSFDIHILILKFDRHYFNFNFHPVLLKHIYYGLIDNLFNGLIDQMFFSN